MLVSCLRRHMQVSFIGYCLQSKFEASAIVTAVSPGQKMQHVNSSATGRICVFFAIAYLSQGISCAQFGVIAQPIQFFLMKGLDLSAAQVSSYMALMMLPWVIKPFYGLISDFVPFLGYRRKSYLVLSNVITSVAFATMIFSQSLFFDFGSAYDNCDRYGDGNGSYVGRGCRGWSC